MDRNSAIGLTLIAALLLGYFYFFSPTSQAPKQNPVKTEAQAKPDSLAPTVIRTESDSALQLKYGNLSAFAKGEETNTTIETNDLKVIFSNKGGLIKELELKQYKTYQKGPLKLITPNSTTFNLLSQYQGKEIDLYSLYYTASQSKKGDTTVLSYSIKLDDGTDLVQTYSIPTSGYEIGYSISSKGLSSQLTGDNLTFKWLDIILPTEKNLADTRKNTTVTYYSEKDGFNKLSEASTSAEIETFAAPLKWVTVKEKFFLTSFIAKNNFAGGEVRSAVNVADSSVVKRADVKLLIPKSSLADGKADFKFYAGPNNYKTLSSVTEKFEKNVYLGWPPVYWINKFAIFPVFHFLTKYISNYGLIIIILVILLKLVLAPLSYKSYLSMAKMKVLKPELDEIKERVGDDMTKVQQEQMKLYQQVGVNPISGCIPVLLQMPILFAMFYLFPASIELRQQSLLWAEDLSTYDSLISFSYALPIIGNHISIFTVLMTAATLISTWQNNQLSSVTGPMKSMSYVMPLIFFFVLNDFSSGLTFYYFISTVVTFGQQAIIRRFVDDNKIKIIMEENRKKIAAGGTGTKSKFMNKLQEAMKASEEARKKADEERKKRKK
ncbi:MAG TPA: membrane protein insertase YidC [Cyclobacteriaceae bacterium]|jgi:YidC/Oxa1 family membrane protein insertase|nr:membrane protein insertase YidC [Cyclobacteriaceae bacterium]